MAVRRTKQQKLTAKQPIISYQYQELQLVESTSQRTDGKDAAADLTKILLSSPSQLKSDLGKTLLATVVVVVLIIITWFWSK